MRYPLADDFIIDYAITFANLCTDECKIALFTGKMQKKVKLYTKDEAIRVSIYCYRTI